MGRSARRAAILSAVLLGGTALGVEPVLMRDLAFEGKSGSIAVGAVTLPSWGAALAQDASAIILEKVSVSIGPATYRMDRVEISGAGSGRAGFEALFDPASGVPLPERIAKVAAKQIAIPELVVEQQIGATSHRSVYRNVVASDVGQGQIGRLVIESGATETATPKEKASITHGRLATSNMNLGAMARLYVERAGPQAVALTRLFGNYEISDMRAVDDAGNSTSIARIQGQGMLARPTDDSWAGALSLVTAMAEIGDPSSEDLSRLLRAAADLAGAFEIQPMEATGIEFREKGRDATGHIARISYRGESGGQPSDLRVEKIEIKEGDQGGARIETMAITGFSFRPTLEGLKATNVEELKDLDRGALRKLLPQMGTVRLSGLDFDAPSRDGSDMSGAKRIRFTLKDLEFGIDPPTAGSPAGLRFAMTNLAFPVPQDSDDKTLQPLLALGYSALDLSLRASAAWNEPAREIVVREVAAEGLDIGSVSLRGVLGNISPDILEENGLQAMVALAAARAKSLELTIENRGLFDRYVEKEARGQKKTPEAIRKEYSAALGLALPIMLGNSAKAKSLAKAVGSFIAKPGRLSITARAKSPEGVALADFGDLQPNAIFDQVDVTAAAEEKR